MYSAIYLNLSEAIVIFTAEKFLLYVAALKGLEGEEAVVIVDELLDLVGLQDVKKKKLRGFSGGMIQRVGMERRLPSID